MSLSFVLHARAFSFPLFCALLVSCLFSSPSAPSLSLSSRRDFMRASLLVRSIFRFVPPLMMQSPHLTSPPLLFSFWCYLSRIFANFLALLSRSHISSYQLLLLRVRTCSASLIAIAARAKGLQQLPLARPSTTARSMPPEPESRILDRPICRTLSM